MSKINKTYHTLKKEFIFEMDFIANVGRQVFLCPFVGRSEFSTICCYFTFSLVFFTSIQFCVTLYFTGFTDWFEIINIAPNLGVCIMILVKYGKIHHNRVLYECISQHYRVTFWEAVSDSTAHKNIVSQYMQTTKLISRFQYYYSVILAVIVDLFPRVIMLFETEVMGEEKKYLYPFDAWYPFDKVQWYYVAYVWEAFMTTVVIFLYAFVNLLQIAIVRYISMELKILGNVMENLICREDVAKIQAGINVNVTHFNIKKRLKFIIAKHQFLANITSSLDATLGDSMLISYLFGSVFICLTVFTATVVDDIYKSVRYFSFFCSLLVETFVGCIMGQLLIDHSAKLEQAIYFADWAYADSDTKKILMIFLMRAQKPFIFSAKGYLTMNLDTFSGICSLSYQLFNLLRSNY